jgi:threonine dehydratase
MIPSLADIRDAARAIEGSVIRTPFLPSPRLSALTGASVIVKYENLQATASFKERGALVKFLSLSEAERSRGIVTMSAGNHAQAVAYHAERLGLPATVVMPSPTPFVKIAATRGFGANVILEGETLVECQSLVERIVAETGATLIHPYNDPEVVRGQGTIGLEILEQAEDLDAVVVPVGGGGLIAGIAIAVKALSPRTEVIGVETELYPSMLAALRGESVACGGETLAEGIAVKNVGAIPVEIARRFVDDILLVGEDAIERAIAEYLLLQKTLAEGAGAVPLAALLSYPERFQSKRVGLILAGGNIDPRLASSIMVRELAREQRIVAVRISISDRPGVLADISATIGKNGGNILEVLHHRTMLKVPAKGATVDVTVETHGAAHASEIVRALTERGYRVERLDPPESRR